eukprot:11022111-Alexandrium_andersonii.AAC.1
MFSNSCWHRAAADGLVTRFGLWPRRGAVAAHGGVEPSLWAGLRAVHFEGFQVPIRLVQLQ